MPTQGLPDSRPDHRGKVLWRGDGGWGRNLATVLLWTLLGGAAWADDGRVFPLPGLPDTLIPYRGIEAVENGLFLTSATGVAWSEGIEWQTLALPGTFAIQTAAMHPAGVLVGGNDGLWIHEGVAWRNLGVDQLVTGPMVAWDGGVFATTSSGVFRVDADGKAAQVLAFPEPVTKAEAYLVSEGLVVLTTRPSKAYWWDGSTLQRAPDYDHLTTEEGPRHFLSLGGGEEGLFFDGARCHPRAPFGVSEVVLRRIYDTYVPLERGSRPVLAARHFYGLSAAGVECYRLADGEHVFTLTNQTVGSPIVGIGWGREGLLVVTIDGVHALPDPGYVRYAPSVKMSATKARRIMTRKGALVLSSRGVVYEDGRPVTGLPVANPKAGVELSSGELVLADLDALYWGERRIPVPEFGKGVPFLLEVGPRQVVAGLVDRLVSIHADGRVYRTEPLRVGSMTVREKRQLIIVNAGGEVVVFDSRDLSEIRRFGGDIRRMYQLDLERDEMSFIATDGTWYTEEGTVMAQGEPWPYLVSVGLAQVRGLNYDYGLAAEDRRMITRLDPATLEFVPLDIPMHSPPVAIGNWRGRLRIMFPQETMTLSTEARPLPRPDPAASLWWEGQRLPLPAKVSTMVDEVELRLPRARTAPWTNPVYAVKVGSGSWQTVAPGARVPVPRLSYGATDIRVRAVAAKWTEETTLAVYRYWPWWAGWRGWLLGGGCIVGIMQGVALLHSRRIRRRARKLEGIVAVRTAELEQARRKAEDASAVKGEFIASINHEIRNPMNGIVGITRILGDGESNPRRRTLLSTLKACTEQLRGSLDDVLDFNVIEREEILLHETDFEWSQLVQSCLSSLDQHGRAFELELPKGERNVRGDSGKVRQILANFGSNALKYGDPSGGRVTLSWLESAPAMCRARVEVFSGGEPLDEAERAALFGLFYRGSRAKATKAPGTGLGLALSRRFAEAMGGEVGVLPVTGGNLFWLELALPQVAEPDRSTPPTEDAGLTGRLVLAIEDENYNRLVLNHYLSSRGLELDWAGTLADAVELIRTRPYQAILTDWFLPDADGGELLQALREANGGELPPVIVTSAYSTQEKREEILAAGAVAFIPKPVDDRRLLAALRHVLAGAPVLAVEESEAEPKEEEGSMICLDRLTALGDPVVISRSLADEFEEGWAKFQKQWRLQPEPASAELHRLRSQALLVEARSLSRKMGLLESVLNSSNEEALAQSLVAEIDAEIVALLGELRSFRPDDEGTSDSQ